MKTIEGYEENASAAILPEVDFSLVLASNDILEQLISVGIGFESFKIYQEGMENTHPPRVSQY